MATAGVDDAHYCYPIAPGGLLTYTAIFAQAANDVRTQAMVNMSPISARQDAKCKSVQQHWLAEGLLDRCDFITTHLRPTFVAEWFTWQWKHDGNTGILQPFSNLHYAPITAQVTYAPPFIRPPLQPSRVAPASKPKLRDH